MNQWFDILKPFVKHGKQQMDKRDEIYDQNGIQETLKLLRSMIDIEKKRYNNEYERIFLGGISQGAMVSLSYLLTMTSKPLGGVYGMITLNPLMEKYYAKSQESREMQASTPLFIINSKSDDTLFNEDARYSLEYFDKVIYSGKNPNYEYHEEDGDLIKHSVSDNGLQILKKWF